MDHQFKRLLNLVRRTGDRLVVTDPNGEDAYVLMGLEAYEKLADTLVPPDVDFSNDFNCGDEFDKYDDDDEEDEYEYNEEINDFDPNWKIPEEFYTGTVGANGHSPAPDDSPEPHVSEPPPSNIWSAMPPAGDKSQTWNPESFGEAERKIIEERFEKPSQNPPKPSHTPSGVVELPEVEPQSIQSPPTPNQISSTPDLISSTSNLVSSTPSGVEETTPKSDQIEDLGEEQFYLEPVE